MSSLGGSGIAPRLTLLRLAAGRWARARRGWFTGSVPVELLGTGAALDAVRLSGGTDDRDARDPGVVLPEFGDGPPRVAVVIRCEGFDRWNRLADAILRGGGLRIGGRLRC